MSYSQRTKQALKLYWVASHRLYGKNVLPMAKLQVLVWTALMHQRVSDKTRGKFYGGIRRHAHQTGTDQVNLNSEVIESTEIIILNNYKLQIFFQKS
ncbi:MAG: hypothetical protein KF908_05875 [Nitrosomonas sp.]|nr:hypothetical protein [Nitrosomonas sp.]MCW5606685.1 hypothetical protein [Nitrosomonas sp.]